ALARETQDPRIEVSALNTLATIAARLGDAAQAHDCHRRALQIARDLGERHLEAQSLVDAADTDVRLGLPNRAAARVRDAMPIIDRIGSGLLLRQARAVLDRV